MFEFLRSKRHKPTEIIAIILRIQSDEEAFAACMKDFGFDERDATKARIAIVIFLYCVAVNVAAATDDRKFFDASMVAAQQIANHFPYEGLKVRVGDVVVSPFDTIQLPAVLEEFFGEVVSYPNNLSNNLSLAEFRQFVLEHYTSWNTLILALFLVRYKQFCSAFESRGNLDDVAMFMSLARKFLNLVTGRPDFAEGPPSAIVVGYEMAVIRGSHVLWGYFARVRKALDAL